MAFRPRGRALVLAGCLLGLLVFGCASQTPQQLRWRGPEALAAGGSPGGKPLFLFFSSPWCYLCKEMRRKVFTDPRVRLRLENEYTTVLLDPGQDHGLRGRFGIRAIPTIILCDSAGREAGRLVGFTSVEELLAALDNGPVSAD